MVQMCYGKRAAASMFTLILLTRFERAGDVIRSYLRAQQIHVLKDKEIDLSYIDCESDGIKETFETFENMTAYNYISQSITKTCFLANFIQ